MAINTNLLVAAPMLQDYLVDNATGAPLANGTISLYQDNSRTTYKNWYYQSGSPGNYTYITLPNPLTLSATGTITDDNGNDTIPFYYPYDETDNATPQPYYIVVTNSNGQQQFTRQNFPFLNVDSSPTNYNQTLRNYIVNNGFWRNAGAANVSSSLLYTLAPSNHEGIVSANNVGNSSAPDIVFLKNKTGATDSVTFNEFNTSTAVTSFANDITPEYYVNMQCTGSTTGETQKCLQWPISLHVNTLSGVEATVTFWAQNVSGTNTMTVSIYQFLGTGATSPSPAVVQTFNLTQDWKQYTTEPFAFPTSNNAVLGVGGDDALFIQFGFPLNTTYQTNFAKPALYLGNVIPTNDFDSYDQINAIVNSPRTGDVRISLNGYGSGVNTFGWVVMNDNTIGSASSNATSRANKDTWPLYNLLWGLFSGNQSLAPMFTSGGAPVAYGASAYADFSANNQLQLTRQAGRVIAGLGAANGGTTHNIGEYTGAETYTLLQTNLPDPINLGRRETPGFTAGSDSHDTFTNIGNATYPFTNSGGNQPFSLIQPTVYYRVYMKL